MPNNQEMAQALLGRLAPPPEPVPSSQGFWQGFAQDALKYAPLGLRATGYGVAHRNPTNGQFIRNPAKDNAPIAASAAAAGAGSGLIDWDKYADPIAAPNKMASTEMPAQPASGGQSEVPMGSFADRFGGAAPGPSFDDRFGGMAPPSQTPAPEVPPWLQGASVAAPPGAGMNVPLPKPKPPSVPLPRPKPRMAKPQAPAPVEESNPIAQFLRSLGLG